MHIRKSNTISDDCAGLGRYFEFLGREFENGGERSGLRDAETEVEYEGDFERELNRFPK